MSNVVQFLEALARNPKPLSADDLAAAMANAGLETTVQRALLDQNIAALNESLGGRGTMLCFIAPAENDEPAKEDEPVEGEEDTPKSEPSSIAA